jgi:hypothetical protein
VRRIMTRRGQYPNSFATGTTVTGASLPSRASSSLLWSPVTETMSGPASAALSQRSRASAVDLLHPPLARPLRGAVARLPSPRATAALAAASACGP